MKLIRLHANLKKKKALSVVDDLIVWALANHLDIQMDPQVAEILDKPQYSAPLDRSDAADFAVVVGGDGTLLSAARAMAPLGIPMLGVHLGGLGFLAESLPEEAETVLQQVLDGDYTLDERVMLEACLIRENQIVQKICALNEITVARGRVPRVLHMRLDIEGSYVTTHSADGLIFATPTGSTAYNLGARGPIVDPRLNVIIITPIAPYSLNAPPLVVDADQKLRVSFVNRHGEPMVLAADGQNVLDLLPAEEVIIQKAPYKAKLITLDPQSFYKKLGTQLGWGHPFTRKTFTEPSEG